MVDFKIWEEVEPPKGTVYNYPIRPWHDEQASLTGIRSRARTSPCRSTTGPIHNQMLARLKDGQTIPQVIAWAQDELEGFLR